MTQWISGPGVGMPATGPIYPPNLFNAPPNANTFTFDLVPGAAVPIPAGDFVVSFLQATTAIEYFDPASTQWIAIVTGLGGPARLSSDGFNYRVRQTGLVATGGSVTAAGSGYAQATTTITPSAGNSTWMPVVGGKIASVTVNAGGSGYTKPPFVFIDQPPSPGIPAVATATIVAGVVTAITLTTGLVPGATAGGAGYNAVPNVVVVPDPFDPAYLTGSITNARATAVLGGAGTLTGVILLNAGQTVGSAASGYTLAVAGSGTAATAATIPVSGSWIAGATDTIILQRC